MTSTYNRAFYNSQHDSSCRSASKVVPHLVRLVRPSSVLDIGCGQGGWLAAFSKCGVPDILGVDGAYVESSQLSIARELFRAADLEEGVEVERRFGLAISLEVAEHLSPRAGDRLVKTLTKAAPVVLFSGAVPGQGGFNHINEQWPRYWAARFASENYRAVDLIRPLIWDDREIEPWYCQNALLYISNDYACESLNEVLRSSSTPSLDVVHPELFKRFVNLEYTSGRRLVVEIVNRVKRRLGFGAP